MSEILEAIKTQNIRVSVLRKWLVWDKHLELWEVRKQDYGATFPSLIYQGKSEAQAVNALLCMAEEHIPWTSKTV